LNENRQTNASATVFNESPVRVLVRPFMFCYCFAWGVMLSIGQ